MIGNREFNLDLNSIVAIVAIVAMKTGDRLNIEAKFTPKEAEVKIAMHTKK